MAGKNKIERSFRIKWDDSGTTARDLTGDLVPGSLRGGGIKLDEVEMTGVSEAVKNYLAGHGDAPVQAQFYLNDTATTGAHTVLSGTQGVVGTLTLQYGANGAAPTTGDPEFEGEYTYFGGDVTFVGGKAVINATFKPGTATPPAWGTV